MNSINMRAFGRAFIRSAYDIFIVYINKIKKQQQV